jgi:hypothetical protein
MGAEVRDESESMPGNVSKLYSRMRFTSSARSI